jgi:glycosyltransferase involved in cell wall biosynthesis
MLKLSILIPSIPNRINKMAALFGKLQAQIDKYHFDNIEILSFLDNKKRSVGYKRDALVQMAMGEYLAFCDDDDDVYDNYLQEIMKALNDNIDNENVDVVVFSEDCTINGENKFTVKFGIEYPNEEAHKINGLWVNITRKPFHSCIWKSSIAKSEHFPDASYGEDWHWCKRLLTKVKTQGRINAVIKRYIFNKKTTEAALVFPK